MCGKKYYNLYTVISYLDVVYLLYMYFKMSLCIIVSCVVCIVVVVLCVLLLVVLCVLL